MASLASPTAVYAESVPCPQAGCGGNVVWDSNACSLCLHTIEPPNVRWAACEAVTLNNRYDAALESLRHRGAEDVGLAYQAAVAGSAAVFATSFDYAIMLLDERRLHQNYHTGVQGRARVAARPSDDALRLSVDAQLFGSVGSRMTMAALSLNKMGLSSYGEVFLEFGERVCSTRGSMLSENSFDFVARNPGGPAALPLGHRSTWADRDRLALVTAAHRLNASTDPDDFPQVLMTAGQTRDQDRFMEVHLYESWGIDAIVAMRMYDGVGLTRHQMQRAEELADRLAARGMLWEHVR